MDENGLGYIFLLNHGWTRMNLRTKAATTDFRLRREPRKLSGHAAFGSNRERGKRCRRCAPVFAALRLGRLPPQSKTSSGNESAARLEIPDFLFAGEATHQHIRTL
jgi:hypothetical protein